MLGFRRDNKNGNGHSDGAQSFPITSMEFREARGSGVSFLIITIAFSYSLLSLWLGGHSLNFCTLRASSLLAHGGNVDSDLQYRNGKECWLLDVKDFDDIVLLASVRPFFGFECQLELMIPVQD